MIENKPYSFQCQMTKVNVISVDMEITLSVFETMSYGGGGGKVRP